ncbi:hypothetical protein AUL39_03365 [Tractidigestivibacter scatoligenes]|uniref:Phage portal protein n=1 Tax=Tractidigestivibacter scatoligenes TaxID=1299998 RepID=A0A100YXA2_TRASO|nr:hypothetical protein [Tractidigestivibacter scatoligenes]KUH59370.1 hypothetical protein AUL39_03365 [Tractidigestivibacter scatoligenes]
MEMLSDNEVYWMPEGVRAYLRGAGYSTRALEDMEPHVRKWNSWMRAVGEFYDYRDTDGFGRVYQVHRRTIMPAMRVCREWGSLLLDEKTTVACSAQQCTDWINSFLSSMNFWGRAQEAVVRAFGLGTGAFAIWMDTARKSIKIRHHDARMVVPLTWDYEGIRECAFVTRCFSKGGVLDQLQMHVLGDDGVYRIRTVCFDRDGREASVPGVAPEVDTGSAFPTFGIVRPAVPNTHVDFSPYGQSVFARCHRRGAERGPRLRRAHQRNRRRQDAGVSLRCHVRPGEDTRWEEDPIPFGKGDCTVFRKVMSTEDTITEFAPALRTEAQGRGTTGQARDVARTAPRREHAAVPEIPGGRRRADLTLFSTHESAPCVLHGA